MATNAQTVTPLSRLSRALGIDRSSNTLFQKDRQQEDEWYIPYTGSYEEPRTHNQITSTNWNSPYDDRGSVKDDGLTDRRIEQETRGRRPRVSSITSVSSAIVNRHHHHKNLSYAPAGTSKSSYVNLGQAGGVGDTPIPLQRTYASNLKNRPSLPSFLSFGPSSKNQSTSPMDGVQTKNGPFRSSSSSSGNTHRSMLSRHYDSKSHARDLSRGSNHDHPYNYSNNLRTERTDIGPADTLLAFPPAAVDSREKPPSPPMLHPYATAFSAAQFVIPTAQSKGKERVAFARQKSIPSHLKPSSRISRIKASISTPDLRVLNHKSSASLSKGKHNWFSAETWCDALLFPRPRFTVRHMDTDPSTIIGSGRIVSPPPSPLLPSRNTHDMNTDSSLKKSKSVVDIRTSNFATVTTTRVVRNVWGERGSDQDRPKSFALDDMALPSPVPSLTTVLANGRTLQSERIAWKKQAISSVGNKHTRSLSRARSKSQSSPEKPWLQMTNEGVFDFLATRTLLGNQSVAPTVNVDSRTSSSRPQTSSGSGLGFGTFSFGSTSQSRTRSKSHGHTSSAVTSQDGHGHRRNGSFGIVLKKAKSAFGVSAESRDGSFEDTTGLEATLKNDDTKKIHLSNWTNLGEQNSSSMAAPNNGRSPSPTRSIPSGDGIGLAFSTPPPSDDHSRTYGEPIRVPAHPYAQGATYSYAQPIIIEHSSHNERTSSSEEGGSAYRQRITHPYAPYGSRLNPVFQDGELTPSRKMFAQISSGQVREIFPEEIQYSPFVTNGFDQPAPRRRSEENGLEDDTIRYSATLRMGEVLNATMRSNRGSPDSGLGASEDHHPFSTALAPPAQAKQNVQRRPVNPPVLEFHDNPAVLFPLPRRKVQKDSSRPDTSQLSTETSDPRSHRILASHSAGSLIHPISKSTISLPPGDRVRSSSSRSSLGMSHDSSPPVSLHPYDNDMDRFQGLFTKIDRRSSSTELVKMDDGSKEVDRAADSGSRLPTNQTMSRVAMSVHQLDIGSVGLNGDGFPEEQVMRGMRHGGLKGERQTDTTQNPGIVISQTSGNALDDFSVPGPSLTMSFSKAHRSTPQIPSENVDDDDVSSLLYKLSEDDYEVSIDEPKVDFVESYNTPSPIHGPHRASTLGYVTMLGPLENHEHTLGEDERQRVTSLSSANFPTSAARSSTMTNDTNLSGLSEFPTPPSQPMTLNNSTIALSLNSMPRLTQGI